ncbi:MAG: hypothetical protein EOM68_27775 [Spirochaetia bacterium]|nr:hypothetical protein [Spirochaetia bacterium]
MFSNFRLVVRRRPHSGAVQEKVLLVSNDITPVVAEFHRRNRGNRKPVQPFSSEWLEGSTRVSLEVL